MSRTTRHIPFDRRGIQPWQATLIGLGDTEFDTPDPRNALERGYDYDKGQTWLTYPGEKYNDGDWQFNAKARRWYKREKVRSDRRKWLAEIKRELTE
ncbi:hypothetical protein EVC12_116 [Rhizobium phage RHph_I42]|nr:hypothetical protein EVC12_116 [Rhizobium phage RHph_I42]